MGILSVIRGTISATFLVGAGSALCIWCRTKGIELLPEAEADAAARNSPISDMGINVSGEHRRVYAFRVETEMSSRHAKEQIRGGLHTRVTRNGEQRTFTTEMVPPLSASLGGLYALHAMESAFPFRCGWILHSVVNTHSVTEIRKVWRRTKPAWLKHMLHAVDQAAVPEAREKIIGDAAGNVERLSMSRYTAQVEGGRTPGAVIWTRAPKEEAEGATPNGTAASPIYAVSFAESTEETKAADALPRSTSVSVVYLSAPYSSDSPTSPLEQVRAWSDEWYSRWFAAHVVKSLAVI